jgi:hypothetical protein
MADRRRRAVAAVAVLVVLLTGSAFAPTQAQTQNVTESQFQALAQRAVDDPRALAQLRAVQQVDGRPVDLRRALEGVEGPALTSRLRTLAGGGGSGAVNAAEARQDAEDVLDGRRFQPSRVPRPLEGVLRTLGRWLKPISDPFGRAWDAIAGTPAAQVILVGLVFLLATVVSVRLVGRRSPASLHRARPFGVDAEGLDPEELERQAAAAERAGDLAHAVRLRFVAGVLRLDRAGVIAYRSSLTTGQLRAALRSGSFAEIASAFDEITYGGRPAGPSDVEQATTGWPRVLAEARR